MEESFSYIEISMEKILTKVKDGVNVEHTSTPPIEFRFPCNGCKLEQIVQIFHRDDGMICYKKN